MPSQRLQCAARRWTLLLCLPAVLPLPDSGRQAQTGGGTGLGSKNAAADRVTFECGDGSQIPISAVGDGTWDCADGSDEGNDEGSRPSSRSRAGSGTTVHNPVYVHAEGKTCQQMGYDVASTAADCQALATAYKGLYGGEASSNMMGCYRYHTPGVEPASEKWYFSDYGSDETTCSGGYECLCRDTINPVRRLSEYGSGHE